MNAVWTVTGPVAPEALGFCQLHEHLFCAQTPAAEKFPALRIDDEEKSLCELHAWKAMGGATLLDAQPVYAGRDAEALRRLSEKSCVNIVAVTGFHRPMFYPDDSPLFALDEEGLFRLFHRELTQGMLSRDGRPLTLRAGAVKAALGEDGVCGRTETLLRAAARAAAACDVPLVLHTERGAGGADAVRLCASLGLPARRVLVCHVDRQAADFAPHDEIAATGAFLEYDTIGRFKYHDDASEVALIRHMLERGRLPQLLLSLDTTAARLGAYGGEIALTYLLTHFLPALRAAGVPEANLETIVRRNPARVFE